MQRSFLQRSRYASLGPLLFAAWGSGVQAQSNPPSPAPSDAARWYIQTSAYTRHFHPDPAHVNHQRLINVERIAADNTLVGAAVFKNSFGQSAQMLYVGKRWHPLDDYPGMHLKLVGGVLHGYKGEYRDKIPFNKSGYAPVILPAVGYTYKNFASELILFGNSGILITLGYQLN